MASGVNRGHLRELERENVNITVDLLDRIANVLGVRVGALFDEMPEGAEIARVRIRLSLLTPSKSSLRKSLESRLHNLQNELGRRRDESA